MTKRHRVTLRYRVALSERDETTEAELVASGCGVEGGMAQQSTEGF